MNDPTVCRNCTSLKGKLILVNAELSELRRFQAEVKQAFGTGNLEKLHLASEVVAMARPASVQWDMAPMSAATSEAMKELADAVKAMASHQTDMGIRPEDGDVEANQQRKSGSFRGPDELDSYDPLTGKNPYG